MGHDLPDSILSSTVSIFADDTRVTKVIRNEEDIERLQDDINIVYEWQEKIICFLMATSLSYSDMVK